MGGGVSTRRLQRLGLKCSLKRKAPHERERGFSIGADPAALILPLDVYCPEGP